MGPARPGDFRLDLSEKDTRAIPSQPGVAQSGLLSDRLQGVLRSRSFTIDEPYVHFLVAGRGGRLSVVIDGFEKIRPPIYGELTTVVNIPDRFPLGTRLTSGCGWAIGLLRDSATERRWITPASTTAVDDGQAGIALDEIRLLGPARTVDRLENHGAPPARQAKRPERRSSEHCARNSCPLAGRLASAIDELRSVEKSDSRSNSCPVDHRRPRCDERIHIRGSHKSLGEVVPRRFLYGSGGLPTLVRRGGSGRERAGTEARRSRVRSFARRACWSTGSGSTTSAMESSSCPDDSGPWGKSPAIPSCRTGWPVSSSGAGGRSRPCTG